MHSKDPNLSSHSETSADQRMLLKLLQNTFDSISDIHCYILDKEYNIILSNNIPEKLDIISNRDEKYQCIKSTEKENITCDHCLAKKCFQEKKSLYEEFKVEDENGKELWFELRVNPIMDIHGEVAFVLERIKEITKEKLNELLLIENEEKYRALYDQAPIPYQSLDINGNILDVNPAWLTCLGFTKQEVIGRWIGEFMDEESTKILKTKFPQFKSKGYIKDVEYKMIKKDGSYIFVSFEGRIGYTPEGDFRQTYCTFKDITSEITVLSALQESERMMHTLLGNLKGIAYRCTNEEDWPMEFISQGCYNLTGYKPEDIIGGRQIHYGDLIIEEDRQYVWDEIQKFTDTSNQFELEYRIQTKKGDIKWVWEQGMFVDETYIEGFITDITDRRKIELQLQKQNRELSASIKQIKKINKQLEQAKQKAEESDRLKTEFLHNMSHEVRTPMNGIVGFSQLLAEPNLPDNLRESYANILMNSSNQLLRIIDDILEISKLETKQIETNFKKFSLHSLLRRVAANFKTESAKREIPLMLNVDDAAEDCLLKSDQDKLRKILHHLVENAFKFTENGSIEIGYVCGGNCIRIYVKDTGIGIDNEFKESIFERFVQEDRQTSIKKGGLGIGLAIAKENAKLLGADISVVSTKGSGSTFTVSIPQSKKVAKKDLDECVSTEKKLDPNKQSTILIVEDEDINHILFETILKNAKNINVDFKHARDGLNAVDIALKNDIDLVLMDIKLPGMDGLEATKLIKEKKPNLPIIAQTAYSSEEDRKKAIEAGCEIFLSKPINRDDFLDKVIGLLERT